MQNRQSQQVNTREKDSLIKADLKAEHKTSQPRSKMSSKQTNTNKYIAQAVAEAASVAMHTFPMAGTVRVENLGPRIGGPIMKHLHLTGVQRQVCQARKFQTRGKNMLQTFNISQTEKVSIIKKLVGRHDLQLLETLTPAEEETYNDEEVLFKIQKKFKP